MITLLRNLFIANFWLKLFSLLLAILVWFMVSSIKDASPAWARVGRAEEQTYFNIPIVLEVSAAAEAHSFQVQPTEVQVTVRGQRGLLRQLHATDIRAIIDVTGIESAHNLRKEITVTAPPGITVAHVVPEKADVIVPSSP